MIWYAIHGLVQAIQEVELAASELQHHRREVVIGLERMDGNRVRTRKFPLTGGEFVHSNRPAVYTEQAAQALANHLKIPRDQVKIFTSENAGYGFMVWWLVAQLPGVQLKLADPDVIDI